jgi:hypothetical protein
LKECVPDLQINADKLYVMPDAQGMQHEETYMFAFGPLKKKWPSKPREISANFPLHPTVIERLETDLVSHSGDMRPYRPQQLKEHPAAKKFYE